MTQQNALEQIQSLCRDFRRQLKNAAPIRIEDYLNRVEISARQILFQNLLHIDIEFQRRNGHEPASEEYIKRFPQHAKLVRQAFFESTLMSADPAAETPAEQRTQLEDVPAGRRLGDYELQRQIGRGAFGAVYQAKHLQRGDVVALKLLPLAIGTNSDASSDADRLHKFRREFRALCDVNHPNLVGMQSLEVDGRQWFFTMDLVEGTDFLDYVRPGGKPNERRLRSAMRQLAEGLAALHQRRIIHRDLKPANVMVDHDGHVIILDFGLVIEERPKADFTVLMTKHGFAGTPMYAAPEQMFGDCEPASDWYAVGIMLFEALTGKTPFRGSAAEIMRAKESTEAPSLTTQSDVPPDLAQLVGDLLQRDPDRRPDAETVLSRLTGTIDTDSRDSTTETPSASSGSASRLTLIGRDQELKTLRQRHRKLQQGREPLAVFVHGRSGEGKTALVNEFVRSLSSDYTSLILSGRCYDRESVPFKAVDAIIDSLVLFLRAQQADDVRRWIPADIGLLAHLFPILRRVTAIDEVTPLHRGTEDTRQFRNRAFAALRDLLSAISAHTPVVLFIDDLQWGDGDSAWALRDILQPPDAPTVMLLGTYRSDEADDSPFLKEWAAYKATTDAELSQHTMEVGPLTIEQCQNLLAVRLGIQEDCVSEQAQQLFEGTRGNPYFLDQLLEGMDPDSLTIEAVPLSELIERRLQRLPPAARLLLKAIAVAGQAVALPEVAAVANESAFAMSTVTHMRNERLVRLIGSGAESPVDTYHDKIRETVLAKLSADERRNQHARFAEWLLQQSPGEHDTIGPVDRAAAHPRVFDVAFHLLESGDHRAFAFQLAAGERAVEEGALDTAQGYLRAAELLLPKDTDDRTRFRLFFAKAETQRGLEQLREAIDSYQQALPLAATSTEAARCESGIGQGALRLGNMDLARRHLARALAHVGERIPLTRLQRGVSLPRVMTECYLLPSFVLRLYRRRGRTDEENAVALSILGTSHYIFMTSYFEMAGILARGSVLGKLSSAPSDRVLAVVGQSNNYAGAGFFRIARHTLRGVEPQFERIESPLQNAIIQHSIGVTYFLSGDLAESETRLVNSLPVLQRVRHYYVGLNLHWLRHIESVRGDAQVIEKWARQELEWGEATGDSMTIAYGKYGLADALSRQGDFETAIQLATEAVDRLEQINFGTVTIARQELGRALLQASDYASAAEVLSSNASAVLWGCMTFEIFLDTFSLRVEALAGPCFTQGPSEFSSAQLRSLKRAARVARWLCGHFPTLRPHAYRVCGRAACATGRFGKAMKYFDEAIRSAERVGARSELARSLIDKSRLNYPKAAADRVRGLALLQELHSVLPTAESAALEAIQSPEQNPSRRDAGD